MFSGTYLHIDDAHSTGCKNSRLPSSFFFIVLIEGRPCLDRFPPQALSASSSEVAHTETVIFYTEETRSSILCVVERRIGPITRLQTVSRSVALSSNNRRRQMPPTITFTDNRGEQRDILSNAAQFRAPDSSGEP